MLDYINEVKDCALFDGIKAADLEEALSCLGSRVRTYQKGEYILLDHEKIKSIGIVLRGKLHMIKEDVWGNKTIFALITTQQLFGETFTCGSDSFSEVTLCAATDLKVLFLPFDRVIHTCTMTCKFHHRLIENMVRMIADKNKSLMEKLEVISQKTLREKLLTYLSLQAQQQGKEYFEIPLGRVDLADYLCADRSAISRELSHMKGEGILDFDKNIFHLLKESKKTAD